MAFQARCLRLTAVVHSGVHQAGSDGRVDSSLCGMYCRIPLRMVSVTALQDVSALEVNTLSQSVVEKKWLSRGQSAEAYR